jgi:hypothetical protein
MNIEEKGMIKKERAKRRNYAVVVDFKENLIREQWKNMRKQGKFLDQKLRELVKNKGKRDLIRSGIEALADMRYEVGKNESEVLMGKETMGMLNQVNSFLGIKNTEFMKKYIKKENLIREQWENIRRKEGNLDEMVQELVQNKADRDFLRSVIGELVNLKYKIGKNGRMVVLNKEVMGILEPFIDFIGIQNVGIVDSFTIREKDRRNG